jgi:hypothetical protein
MPDPMSDIQQPGAPQMQSEVEAMSSPSKAAMVQATRAAAVEAQAKQGLQAATGGGGQVPPPLNDQIAMHLMRDTEVDPEHPEKYIQAVKGRIAETTKLASDAKTAGKTDAYNTYSQVASIMQQHFNTLLDKHTAHIKAIAAEAIAKQNAQVQAQNEALGYK